jgi:hypothetical protein
MKFNFNNLSVRRNKIVLIVAVLSIFAVCLMRNSVLSSDTSTAVKKHASIAFPVKSYNFGNVTGGKTVSHRFIFYNRGGDVLMIEKISAG